LIYSMAQVYRLHVMSAWDTWRTTAGFFLTSALLGQLAMNNLLGGTKPAWGIVAVLLAVELAMMLSGQPKARWSVTSLRVGLSAAAMLGAVTISSASNGLDAWISPVIFLLVAINEIIGRVLFYNALDDKPL
jgi:DMSO reductase anchor subunit